MDYRLLGWFVSISLHPADLNLFQSSSIPPKITLLIPSVTLFSPWSSEPHNFSNAREKNPPFGLWAKPWHQGETQTTTNSVAPSVVATVYWSLCASTPLLIKCNFRNGVFLFLWHENLNLLLAFGRCEKYSWVWGRNLLSEHSHILPES